MDVDGSTWEERMSQRAKGRMLIAEAEEIARRAAEGTPDPGPGHCVECGGELINAAVFSPRGGPWCFDCEPGATRYVVRDGRLVQLPETRRED